MRNNRETLGTKKMWSHFHGIVDVKGLDGDKYPLSYSKDGCFRTFSSAGIYCADDTRPILISMEQAEKQGLVKKKTVCINRKRIKYLRHDVESPAHEYDITFEVYANQFNFGLDLDYKDVSFVSFVDEKLNECDPPKMTIEWEEV
jgi:hypothetical protein